MKIYLLRHAKRGHGKEQDTLTEEGMLQAKELKNKLKEFDFDRIYCSPSNRCRKTIEPFLEDFKGIVKYTKELEEMRLGVLQGKTAQEFKDSLQKSGLDKNEFRPINGENLNDFEIRVKQFISFLKSNEKENILISTHAGVIRLFKKFLTNKNELEIQKANFASIFCIEIK